MRRRHVGTPVDQLVAADGGWVEWPDDALEVDDDAFARAIAAGRAAEADQRRHDAA